MSEPIVVRHPLGKDVSIKLVPSHGGGKCDGCAFRSIHCCITIKNLPSCDNQLENHIYIYERQS